MSALMRCFDMAGQGRGHGLTRAAQRVAGGLAIVLASLLVAAPAAAHKSSDAYLQLAADGEGSRLRIDIALRDLDNALDIDADADGRLTWGEVKAAWPAIDTYVQARVRLDACAFNPPPPALEQRADGVYAVLDYRAACPLLAAPVLRYTVLGDVDPTHRGLFSILRTGAAPELRVLDPVTGRAEADPGAPGATASGPVEAAAPAGGSPWQFVREGIHHIVGGYDHVLFLLCLLLPSVMRRTERGWVPVERLGQALWPIIGIVTAFTLAHSITLALASLRLATLPSSFIEPAIAVTIALAALDNLWPIFRGRRVLVTFLFGLIHGFGFAGVLAEMELPAASFAWALLQFNVGLELGQVAIVLAATLLLFVLRRSPRYPTTVIGGGSALAILIAAGWFLERTAGIAVFGG